MVDGRRFTKAIKGYLKDYSLMMDKSQELYKKAKRLIPGGTQLFSKRPEMFLPDLWPAYYSKAKGCDIWDLDGNKYTDMSYMGIGACILGYADKDVDKAVKKAIDNSSMTTLNCPEEVELAQVLCDIHRWADMARFARTGGEAMAIAVRIARANTGKDLVLFCGYHGWHDWYLSANLADNKLLDGHLLSGLQPKGVPRALKGSSIPFNYNDTKGFLSLIHKYKNGISAIVMEPLRNYYPKPGFLETIRRVSKKMGIVLIFDEITSGWRLNPAGAHLTLGVYPDIAVFGKAMSNGYPMAAILGKRNIMKSAQDTFISSTYWTERIGPVAALATIRKLKDHNVCGYLRKIGKNIQQGWRKSANKYNLNITIYGTYPLGHFSFNYKDALILKTLFTQQMLEKKILATTAFYASYAHKDIHLKEYLRAVNDSFSFISQVIKKGNSEKYLKSSVCHANFKRLN